MIHPEIPSQLQNKLAAITVRQPQAPLFIETGEDCLGVAYARLDQIVQKQRAVRTEKKSPASSPTFLVLLSQEYLETTQTQPGVSPCSSFTCLSESQSPRDDISALEKPSGVLITTPQRAIDHIRRDNIFLAETKTVIIVYGFNTVDEETEENRVVRQKAFLDDIQFVFTKLSPTVAIECYLDDLSQLSRQPQEIVEQSVILARSDWESAMHPLEFRIVPKMTAAFVTDVLYALHFPHYFVVYREEKAKSALSASLRKDNPPLYATFLDYGQLLTKEGPRAPLSGMVVAYGLSLEEITTLIRRMRSWTASIVKIVCIISPQQAGEISQSKETMLMNNETKKAPESIEVLAGKIQMIASKIRIDANPEELETFKKLIRQNVPLFDRRNFTAYLLREALNAGSKPPATPKERTESKPKQAAAPKPARDAAEAPRPPRPKREAAQAPKKEANEADHPEVVIPEGAKTLYLNIGKMKRLYAKELSTLLQTELGITREDIYSVRIHDKYSFITLSEAHAELAIAKLNGMDIKGRIAAVSYSNKE
jgi:hypothetical protein